MLTTLQELKNLLEITDTSQDAVLTMYIAGISAACESYCNRKFGIDTYTVTLDPTNLQVIQLPQWPVAEVTSVTHGEDAITDYELKADSGILIRDKGWTRPVTVEFTAGYKLPGQENRNLPHDIEYASLMWCMLNYNTALKAGIKQERIDDISVSYESPFTVSVSTGGHIFPAPPTVMALLNPYRGMNQ